ncbi:recombinase family protein [Rothia uropygioeca]|uniref:recombinase family protein n=1 Tax=Kocuria sp. 257 TaxID=2021970 RepID=UPI0013EDF2BD|nr:recombinase family protein [Kocuria sp. 257]
MTKAILYLRSATGNREQIQQQQAHCREYLAERGLTEAGTITDTGHPQEGFTNLLDTALKATATEVVVTDLSRLGRKPLASMKNFDALDRAGLTIPYRYRHPQRLDGR